MKPDLITFRLGFFNAKMRFDVRNLPITKLVESVYCITSSICISLSYKLKQNR